MDNIRALSRGIDILYCFGDSSDELGVTDISRLLKLNKTTASRMLATLAAKGLIVENPATRKYRLTYKLVTIANAQLRRLNVRERALPHMRALRDLTDETVLLYVPLGYERSCVEQVESTHEIRRAVRIGQAYPITSGATGRTLLAWRSEAEIEDALAGAPLKPITPFTLATKEPFLAELAQVRANGYAVGVDETQIGVSGLATPVRNYHGDVVAAIGVSGPSSRWTRERMLALAPQVVALTQPLSAELGYGLPDQPADKPAPRHPTARRRRIPVGS